MDRCAVSFDMTFAQGIVSSENMESERVRIAAITPFGDAQAEAIRVVRGWTRAYIVMKISNRNIIDLQDIILNSPAEQAAIDDIRTKFGNFLTDANAATNLAQLSAAWNTYKTGMGL